ncbi:hypothetical protein PAMP_005533 [Pampus punctatissimus]
MGGGVMRKSKRSQFKLWHPAQAASREGTLVAPRWCSSWQACSELLSAPRCPGNRLPLSSSCGDGAALIDNNGKWQNRWETREGCE